MLRRRFADLAVRLDPGCVNNSIEIHRNAFKPTARRSGFDPIRATVRLESNPLRLFVRPILRLLSVFLILFFSTATDFFKSQSKFKKIKSVFGYMKLR